MNIHFREHLLERLIHFYKFLLGWICCCRWAKQQLGWQDLRGHVALLLCLQEEQPLS